MAAVSAINTENGKVSYETPEGTVVNIHVTQRSALDCLLDTIRIFRGMKRSGTKAKPTRGTGSTAHLGIGVSLMSFGCICVMLAVILCTIRPEQAIFSSGMQFWVGIPFIISGALNVVSYRYPKKCWEILAFMGALVSLGVSIGGMVFLSNNIKYFWWGRKFYICDRLRNRGYGYTQPPRGYDNSDQYVTDCKEEFLAYQKLMYGVIIMTLLMVIWGLCASLVSLGYRMKAFCCACAREGENSLKERAVEESGAAEQQTPTDEKDESLPSADRPGDMTIA